MISTLDGDLVAPMVTRHGVRVIRSKDNGQTWLGSNLDESFPKGNEDRGGLKQLTVPG